MSKLDTTQDLLPGVARPVVQSVVPGKGAREKAALAREATVKRGGRPRAPLAQDYFDYRDYLRDFFEAKKAINPAFSHRLFARQAGLGSPSYLLMVIARKRNLSIKSLRKFIDGLGLKGRERVYFETLVRYDQSEDIEEKSQMFSELLKLRKKSNGLHGLERERFEFLSKWHAVAIYVMAALPAFQNDPEWIARRLRRKITSAQAKDALVLLVKLGLLVEQDGRVIQAQGAITVQDDTRSMAVAQYHEALIRLAYDALKKMPLLEREMAGATIAVPAHRLGELKEKIRAFRKEINSWSSEFQDADQVFQMNIQLFPLTDRLEEGNSK